MLSPTVLNSLRGTEPTLYGVLSLDNNHTHTSEELLSQRESLLLQNYPKRDQRAIQSFAKGVWKINIEILRVIREVKPQRLKQTNKYFLCYKQLNTFDHPHEIHKYLDREPSTFLLVNRYIIFNKFDKDIQLHMIIIHTSTLSGQKPLTKGTGVTRIVPMFVLGLIILQIQLE